MGTVPKISSVMRTPAPTVTGLAVALLIASGLWLVLVPGNGEAYGGAFLLDPFARLMKVLALVGSVSAMIMSVGYARSEQLGRFEFPVLLVLATRTKLADTASKQLELSRHPLLGQLQDAIEANYRRLRAPSDYARLLHVTPKTLGRIVKEELYALPDDYKEILVLRDIEGLPYGDIARVLGIQLSNVKVRIHRGRELLKKRLAERGLL